MSSIIQERIKALKKLCRKYQVQRMYVFGSAGLDRFTDTSDLDFLISFSPELSITEYTENYFSLHEELENLFNRKIDLITERSLSNPYFIQNIEASRQLLYEA